MDQTVAQALRHEGRRNDHKAHVPVRVDSPRFQEMADQIGVGGEGIDGGEGEGIAPLRLAGHHHLAKRGAPRRVGGQVLAVVPMSS